MTLSVTTPVPSARTTSDHRIVSPELALIDPVLAAEERARLPDPIAVAPSRRNVDVPRDDERRALQALASAALEAHDPGLAERERTRRAWPRLVAVAAGSVLLLLLLDVRVDVGRTPASAESSETAPAVAEPALEHPGSAPPVAETSSESTAPSGPSKSRAKGRAPSPPAPTAVPRRFAWAPVDDADAYRVELFRGNTRVFEATTSSPELTVPPRWTLDGKRRSLTAGEYRWYVWPIVAGRRSQRAVVQATLTVP
jgi:hypothetical protein